MKPTLSLRAKHVIRGFMMALVPLTSVTCKSLLVPDDNASSLSVREARAGDRVEPGVALLAPGGHHLRLSGEGHRPLRPPKDTPRRVDSGET